MLSKIKQFFYAQNPEIIVQAPSRINLINPLDAVEGDYWMPSVAINGYKNPLSSFVYIKKSESSTFYRIYSFSKNAINIVKEQIVEYTKLETLKNHIEGDLINATIYRFSQTYPSFWEKFSQQKIEIGILTTIPRQSGLGGSASIIVAIIFAFTKYFCINNPKILNLPINKDIIAEMAMRVEDLDLKITAGYSDRYIISRGGLAFCSYVGKLYHTPIGEEPLAVYDRIDQTYDIRDLPLIVCHSGIIHNSGSIHSKLRELYLSNNAYIKEMFEEMGIISWKSRYALMNRDWELLGTYFKMNTLIMNKVMKEAGFEFGIGSANNILIDLIQTHSDVYAAKLTGAGGGGSVFALTKPSKVEKVLLYWKKSLMDLVSDIKGFNSKYPNCSKEIREGLALASFFRVKIDKFGVKELK